MALAAAIAAVALAAGLVVVLVRVARERLLAARQLRETQKELERLQGAFARFAPPRLVDRIIDSGTNIVAERKAVTILFADLQGFTALTEKLDPDVLMRLLGGYFSAMSEAITAHHGHLNRFIGDGLVALFGALDANPWQARDAVEAGLAMRSNLAAYNRGLAAEGLPCIEMGVGINHGVVVVGVVGHETLLQFDVLGDAVNVAARVEQLTRSLGAHILVTDTVKNLLDDTQYLMREMPPASVKGKSKPIATFAVDGKKEA
jgi:class 3 adenylate cyclase